MYHTLNIEHSFLGGIIESIPDGCITEDLQWAVDLNTMQACRLRRFKEEFGVKAIACCPRGKHFVVLLEGKDHAPLLYVHDKGTTFLPPETKNVTRASPCDATFSKVALYMTHNKQIVVWNRKLDRLETFARCPGIADFVTCCYEHLIYAITYEAPQRLLTYSTDSMCLVDSEVISETQGYYGRLFKFPFFPTMKTEPYVAEGDAEVKRWVVGEKTLHLDLNTCKIKLKNNGF